MFLAGERKLKRMKLALAERRVSPTREEFISMLTENCEADIAELLRDELLVFYKPDMTPHPDDDVVIDMPIDGDEPNDWLSEFCKRNGLRLRDITDWPKDQSATVRNLATWFSENRKRLAQS
jgi:hypothetical protein